MNSVITMEEAGLQLQTGDHPLRGILASLASRSKKSARELPPSVEEVFKGITEIIDQILQAAIAKRTGAEYREAFPEAFGKYFSMVVAISRVATAVVPKDVLERLGRESICEMEAEFRAKGLPAFGEAVRDQALFTVWTLRKISDLVSQIEGIKLDDSTKKDEDTECSQKFAVYGIVGRFSLDCLNTALRLNQPIYPEVLDEIMNGLRSMVNAYTWVRRGVDLHVPRSEELEFEVSAPDAEDEELIRSSMQDMANMTDADSSDAY